VIAMSDDPKIIERIARLEEQYKYLIRELEDIKSTIKEINIVTKYILPILMIITFIVSVMR
jgi:uncharacterized protein (UPF0335 family)